MGRSRNPGQRRDRSERSPTTVPNVGRTVARTAAWTRPTTPPSPDQEDNPCSCRPSGPNRSRPDGPDAIAMFPGGGMITPQAAVIALIRRLNQDPPDGENGNPAPESKPVEDKDKARFARLIRDLVKLAFDASATPQECKTYLDKATDLARKYGLSWFDLSAAETAAGAPAAPGPGDEGELLPEPANPLAVARVVLAEWT